MNPVFFILALLTLASAVAAVSLRNLVHCALCLVVTFAGLAGIYLQLQAEFAGFAQILVYIGAVAILIVFAILLTRGSEVPIPGASPSVGWWGWGIAGAVFLALCAAILSGRASVAAPAVAVETGVQQLGQILMRDYVVPLEGLALLLTAAVIGAVVIAMEEKERLQKKTAQDRARHDDA